MKKKDAVSIEKYMHIDRFDVPLYFAQFVVILSNDKKAVEDIFPTIFFDSDLLGYAFSINYKGKDSYVVVLNLDHPRYKITHGVVSHEVFHVVNMLCDSLGIVLDMKNDEPMAYLIQWFVDNIYEVIKKRGFEWVT